MKNSELKSGKLYKPVRGIRFFSFHAKSKGDWDEYPNYVIYLYQANTKCYYLFGRKIIYNYYLDKEWGDLEWFEEFS